MSAADPAARPASVDPSASRIAAGRRGWTARLAVATLRRDGRIATSYRTGFALTAFSSLINLFGLFFLSGIVQSSAAGPLATYGGSYFGFIVLGVAFTSFMALGVGGLASSVRESQLMGTLEIMVLSPTRLATLLVFSAIWAHLMGVVSLLLYVAVGAVLGMPLGAVNLPVAVAGMLLAIVSFNAIGLVAAAVVIVIKQGNPVSILVSSLSALLGGVFYPVSVLPEPLRLIGQLVPLTHALEIERRAVFAGAGFAELWPSFLALIVLTAILVPVGVAACRVALRVALTDGSLAQY